MTWPTAVDRSLLAALGSANEVAMDEALMELSGLKVKSGGLGGSVLQWRRAKIAAVLSICMKAVLRYLSIGLISDFQGLYY
jgi:hypothetical protein